MTGAIVRRALEAVSIAAVIITGWITVSALYGPNAISNPVTMINPLSNHPRDWGTRAELLQIPAVQLVFYGFGFMLARYAGALNFPVRVTAGNRSRLEPLARSMIAWLKAEILVLVAWTQWLQIREARGMRFVLSPIAFWAIVAVFGATILGHYIAMRTPAPK